MLPYGIVVIDGYVATGKGTTAKGVSKILGYPYLDTGAMYRAVTLYALQNNLLNSSEDIKRSMMRRISLDFIYNKDTDHNDIFLNGKNVEIDIRQPALSSLMKPIVTSPVVRACLVAMQSTYGKKGLVADGRDMGTIVFPYADLKIFLVCDIEVRAKRRFLQLENQGREVSLQEVRKNLIQRDNIDYLSDSAVNVIAGDAVVIDTTILTIDQVVSKIVFLYRERINSY